MDLIMFITFMVSGSIYAFRGEVMFALGCFFISAIFWMAYKIGMVAEKVVSIKATKELVEKLCNALTDKEKSNEK